MKQRKPNRLQGYDYSSDNLYFVTSCVHDMICCFGEISAPRMVLNDYGKIAEKQWYWLGEQYPYVVLHAFIVMPNHIHGIIEINRAHIAGTGRDLSLQQHSHGNDLFTNTLFVMKNHLNQYLIILLIILENGNKINFTIYEQLPFLLFLKMSDEAKLLYEY